ncbi:MAG TPA: sn-glycerol-3-phosphate ABC transporter ATP-binding protein UgpC [Solirubrobacteraceae bacterium]|nr:sn-glycerol-3-phosphate ABC transporter ATP-binding protein UgpC [Solirubrobacteraceae bacterium]
MAEVKLEHVTHVYPGSDRAAVKELTLTAEDGEFLVLVGPSGCGKTTALRMVAGLEETHGGSISIGGRDVTNAAPKTRDVAMVFQNYALYPHMTVRRNIAYGLQVAHLPKDEIAKRVADASKMLGLQDLLDRKPSELSGGQRQRVAMGRAVVRVPQVYLMDEPLSNLDAKLRSQTRNEIIDLQKRLATTTLYVTHDQVEAMTMGHRVAVMRDGELQQIGAPREIYTQPSNVFVATFVGAPPMAVLRCPVDPSGTMTIGSLRVDVGSPRLGEAVADGSVLVGVRAEDWRHADGSEGVSAAVTHVEDLGADTYVHAVIGEGDDRVLITASRLAGPEPKSGEVLTLVPNLEKLHLFSVVTSKRLPDSNR